MSIIERAKAELDAINFGEEDTAVMIGILKKFFNQWDSGGAVASVAPVLQRLIAGKPLSPLTGADSEWIDRSEMSGRPMWQNMRCGTVFKSGKDGPAWDIEVLSQPSITFPYWPDRADVRPPVIEFEVGS